MSSHSGPCSCRHVFCKDNLLYLSCLLARRGEHVPVNEHHQLLIRFQYVFVSLCARFSSRSVLAFAESLSATSLPPSLVLSLSILSPPFPYLGRHSHLVAATLATPYQGFTMSHGRDNRNQKSFNVNYSTCQWPHRIRPPLNHVRKSHFRKSVNEWTIESVD